MVETEADLHEGEYDPPGRVPLTTALVTGANRGIGLALCVELLDRNWDVIATARNPAPALGELAVRVEELEVDSDDSVRALSERMEGVELDLLVHNAGISVRDTLDNLDSDSLLLQYNVNALGPLRLTAALRKNLDRGSKVAIVSSRMGSLSDNFTGRQYGYRASKAAVNMIGVNLARDLAPEGIALVVLHPGYVRTDMTEGRGERTPLEAARGLVARIEELTLASTGSFWHADGRALPW